MTVSMIYCMSLCVQTNKAFFFYTQFITYSMKSNLGFLPSKEKQLQSHWYQRRTSSTIKNVVRQVLIISTLPV